MIVWGVDNSINGTGLCVIKMDDIGTINSVAFHGFSKTRNYADKREVVFKENNVEITHLGSSYSTIPYHHRPEFISKILLDEYGIPDYAFFEDYALSSGSKSNNLTYVAEFCGGLKECLYRLGCRYYVYTPSQIKLFGANNGNADKLMMGAAFEKAGFGDKFIKSDKFMALDDGESPKADIIDAFWIAALGRFHILLKLDKHRSLLQSLTDKKASMFVDKKKKRMALIDEPFIVRKD